jgi:hypothetical protein
MRSFGSWLPRRRFFVACAAGGVVAAAVFAWVVFQGRRDVLAPEAPEVLGGFYDAQARGLLHGHWDVPAKALSFERFTIDGRYYMYFGPWPAVLRMPIIAFTDDYDGRLSRLSMLLAFVILLVFAARLAWQARTLLQGEGPVSRATLISASGFVFIVGCGSTTLFLAARAWVYYEAILWGIAWAVASFSFLVAYLVTPRARHLAWAGVTATLALLSRASVGVGPVIALAAVLAVQVTHRIAATWRRRSARPSHRALARWLGVSDTTANQTPWRTAIAVVMPIALYAYVNYAKFGSLFSLPYDKQDVLLRFSERRAALAASNQLFSLKYAPTNLVQYLRPDAIGFDRLFPWVTFSSPPRVFGDVPYDNIEPTASIPAVSTLLFTLAMVGVVAAVRAARRARDQAVRNAAVLRVPLLAAALATAGTLVIADLIHRYEGDFVPVLVIGAAAGLFWLPMLLAGRRSAARRLVAGALAVLAVWSVLATLSLTLQYQRAYSAFQPAEVRARFVGFQLDVSDALGLGPPTDIHRGPTPPVMKGQEFPRTTAPLGRLFIVGNCASVYQSTGKYWQPVEEPPPGAQRWRVSFATPTPGSRQPLWSTAGHTVWARWADRHHIRFEYQQAGAHNPTITGTTLLRVERRIPYDLDIRLDAAAHYIEIKRDKDLLLSGFSPTLGSDTPSSLGSQPNPTQGPTTLNGTIHYRSATPICDRLAAMTK